MSGEVGNEGGHPVITTCCFKCSVVTEGDCRVDNILSLPRMKEVADQQVYHRLSLPAVKSRGD